jgi:MtN3 and saliva related transmembrane protein
MDDLIDTQILGTLALIYGLGAAATVLMQARQVLATGSSRDVSARFFATYAGGYAIWLLYGLALGSTPIIVVHAVGLVCGVATLLVTLRARGSLRRPGTWLRGEAAARGT